MTSRRLAPYLLLGLLTLGAGLGVGLGLSEGPVTYTATVSAWGPCTTSSAQRGVNVQCSARGSTVWVYFRSKADIPTGFADCMANALAPIAPTTNGVGLTRALKAVDSMCNPPAVNATLVIQERSSTVSRTSPAHAPTTHVAVWAQG
jgi:hypothetical protein